MNNRIRHNILFAYQGIKDRNVASLVPTFSANVEKICSSIPKNKPVTILEYGPGTGPFTQYFLDTLHPDSVVVAIDQNQTFVDCLHQLQPNRSGKAPQCHVIHGDAAKAPDYLKDLQLEKVDYCFSGIPISFLPREVKLKIIRQTRELLSPQGCFYVYQVSPHAKKFIEEVFPECTLKIYWRNIPPLFVMEACQQ